jgi:hypothetical protein
VPWLLQERRWGAADGAQASTPAALSGTEARAAAATSPRLPLPGKDSSTHACLSVMQVSNSELAAQRMLEATLDLFRRLPPSDACAAAAGELSEAHSNALQRTAVRCSSSQPPVRCCTYRRMDARGPWPAAPCRQR